MLRDASWCKRVIIKCGKTDLRRGITGLVSIIRLEYGLDPFYGFIESLDLTDPLMNEKMKEAINYSLTYKENLCLFLSDGHVPCDNGFAENAIRLYAQGRRNWLFSNTPAGA